MKRLWHWLTGPFRSWRKRREDAEFDRRIDGLLKRARHEAPVHIRAAAIQEEAKPITKGLPYVIFKQ